MKYDFTTVYDRRGRDALAVDLRKDGSCPQPPKEGFDLIPMWVADMNFATVPTIPQAIGQRLEHPGDDGDGAGHRGVQRVAQGEAQPPPSGGVRILSLLKACGTPFAGRPFFTALGRVGEAPTLRPMCRGGIMVWRC